MTIGVGQRIPNSSLLEPAVGAVAVLGPGLHSSSRPVYDSQQDLSSGSSMPSVFSVNPPNLTVPIQGYTVDSSLGSAQQYCNESQTQRPDSPVIVVEGNPDVGKNNSWCWDRMSRKQKCFVVLGVLIALILIGVIAVAARGQSDPTIGENTPAPQTFSPAPSVAPTISLAPTTLRFQIIRSTLKPLIEDELGSNAASAMDDNTLAQGQALQWLTIEDENDNFDDNTLLQRYALATLFFSTGGPQWDDPINFLSTIDDECEWNNGDKGAFCGGLALKVDRLDLSKNSLLGTLPDEILLLSKLRHVSFSFNQLRGPIPAAIGTFLSDLETLEVIDNDLTGPIPTSLGNHSSLQSLRIGVNLISGTIPPTLFDSLRLEELTVESNVLNGTVPPNVGQLSNMRRFWIGGNDLSGSLPSSIGEWTQLESFVVRSNRLSGPVLKYVTSFDGKSKNPRLSDILANNNEFTGSIPSHLFRNHPLLTSISLASNKFNGTLPAELGLASNLNSLFLEQNEFVGSLPSTLGQLQSLTSLNLASNQFNGSIPTIIGSRMTRLSLLDMSLNNLQGILPLSLGELVNLRQLFLQKNELTGTVPMTFAQLSPSLELDLSLNFLEADLEFLCDSEKRPSIIIADCDGPSPEINCTCCDSCCNRANVCD